MNRRTFFKGLAASSLAAPAIIKYELLMPVKSLIIPKMSGFLNLGHVELNTVVLKKYVDNIVMGIHERIYIIN